ncbi:hypothetical protein CROQUDRAFT_709284 [Cronartium quercuum f. sp. fusiforme G11]|uniref:Uncharacterized protein n=1 Tax=Cronartium quercuum f. sp. fusiforme G11 TaxID=708437 RepID=A0A9P6NCX2_9BASI|nr:hypothetical protein CROQUDRAFT_709284 [Cronartium quercuum f. sp. fusiforme G11]
MFGIHFFLRLSYLGTVFSIPAISLEKLPKLNKINSSVTHEGDLIFGDLRKRSLEAVKEVEIRESEVALPCSNPETNVLNLNENQTREVGFSNELESEKREPPQRLSGYAPEFYDPNTRISKNEVTPPENIDQNVNHDHLDHTNFPQDSVSVDGDGRMRTCLDPSEVFVQLHPIDMQKWALGNLLMSTSPLQPPTVNLVPYLPIVQPGHMRDLSQQGSFKRQLPSRSRRRSSKARGPGLVGGTCSTSQDTAYHYGQASVSEPVSRTIHTGQISPLEETSTGSREEGKEKTPTEAK